MQNLKRGFTLNELLITLAIIGVVAALVMPGITHYVNSTTSAKNIARAYELVQNGMNNILVYAGENSDGAAITTLAGIQVKDITKDNNDNNWLLEADDGKAIFSRTLGLIGAHSVDNAYLADVKTYANDDISTVYEGFSNWDAYKFAKSNGYIIVQPIDGNLDNLDDQDDDTVLTRIFIDANGDKEPNVIGRDIFLFGLANNGHLVAAGTAAYNDNIFNETIDLFRVAEIGDGRATASSIMQNKWEIKY